MNSETPSWLDVISQPRLAPVLIASLGLLLFFVRLDHPLYTKGEAREGVQVADVVEGRGVILPRAPSVEMPFKPPMMRWLASLVSLAAGRVDEWTLRAPSAALAVGGMLTCYAYMRILFEPTAALIAALVLGTSLQYLQAGTGARVDMTLTFFLSLASWEFLLMAQGLTRRRLLFYLSLAAAVLSKGPVGLLLPAAAALLWSLYERRRFSVNELRLGAGLCVVAAIVGTWYAWATLIGGSDFLRRQIVGENFYAFFSDPVLSGGHDHPFYWLEAALLIGFLPWTFFLPWLCLDLFRRRQNPRVTYLLIWIAVVLVFYSLARQKRGVYLLALYPALAGLLGRFLADLIRSAGQQAPHWVTVFSRAFAVTALIACGTLLGLFTLAAFKPTALGKMLAAAGLRAGGLAPNLRLAVWRYPFAALALLAALAATGGVLLARSASPARLFALTTAGMLWLMLTAELFFVPAIADTLTLRAVALQLPKIIDGCPIAYLGGLSYSVAFYYRSKIPILAPDARDWPPYLLVWRKVYADAAPRAREDYAVLMQSGPTELDGSGGILLLKRRDLEGAVCER
jgi:4-amino-4-deoxy-L-arabinose transferase-like glycosyltransferase